jgi:hypothetical protein
MSEHLDYKLADFSGLEGYSKLKAAFEKRNRVLARRMRHIAWRLVSLCLFCVALGMAVSHITSGEAVAWQVWAAGACLCGVIVFQCRCAMCDIWLYGYAARQSYDEALREGES